MLGNKASILDYLDLILFRLAKLQRNKINKKLDLTEFYNEFFTENDFQVFNSGRDRRKTYKAEILNRIANTISVDSLILDIGCGVGDNLKSIYRSGPKFIGLEYSEKSLECAKRILPPSVELHHGSATGVPFSNYSIDLVMCIEVLEHIPDQYQALREINRVLKEDGFLILSVPYRRWFPSYFTFMGHYRHYTRSELEILLNECNFQVIEFLPNYPHWHRLANYSYMFCRVISIFCKLIGYKLHPHELRLPFTKVFLLDFLFDRIDTIKNSEDLCDYSQLDTSTFILAKKIHK